MKLKILIHMHPPKAKTAGKQVALPLSVEDRIKDALEKVDSGHESKVEWMMIHKFYKELCDMNKKSPRVHSLIMMIEPVLAKFGYHKVTK